MGLECVGSGCLKGCIKGCIKGCLKGCIKGCEAVWGLPCRVLCVLVLMGQFAALDYYLITYTSPEAAGWLVLDVANLVLVVTTLLLSLHRLRAAQSGQQPRGWTTQVQSMAWFAWFLYSSTISVKTITLFRADIVHRLEANDVWSRNTLKTAIAGSGLFFFLFLMGQHSASPSSRAGRLIQDLSGTVLFDILDAVDILEILFDGGGKEKVGAGAEAPLLLFATLSLAAPSWIFLTLSGSQYGKQRLSRQVVVIHKMAVTVLVNLPFLILRMVFWHGFSIGVSPFIVKNFVLIAASCHEVYEHFRSEALELDEDEGVRVVDWTGSTGFSTETSSTRSRTYSDPPYMSASNGRIPMRRRPVSAGRDNDGFMMEVTL